MKFLCFRYFPIRFSRRNSEKLEKWQLEKFPETSEKSQKSRILRFVMRRLPCPTVTQRWYRLVNRSRTSSILIIYKNQILFWKFSFFRYFPIHFSNHILKKNINGTFWKFCDFRIFRIFRENFGKFVIFPIFSECGWEKWMGKYRKNEKFQNKIWFL